MKTEMIKATELNAGDMIAMEYGDDGNFMTGIVISTRKEWWGSFVITFKYNDGTERIRECCPDRNGNIEKVVA